jgi:hypothetical protein
MWEQAPIRSQDGRPSPTRSETTSRRCTVLRERGRMHIIMSVVVAVLVGVGLLSVVVYFHAKRARSTASLTIVGGGPYAPPRTDPRVLVKLDGHYVAMMSSTGTAMVDLEPGRHVVAVSAPGYVTYTEAIRALPSDEEAYVCAKLKPYRRRLPRDGKAIDR